MTYSLPDQFDRVAPGKAGRRPPVGAVGLFFFVTALSPEFECDPDLRWEGPVIGQSPDSSAFPDRDWQVGITRAASRLVSGPLVIKNDNFTRNLFSYQNPFFTGLSGCTHRTCATWPQVL
jgi:hypothetical protein